MLFAGRWCDARRSCSCTFNVRDDVCDRITTLGGEVLDGVNRATGEAYGPEVNIVFIILVYSRPENNNSGLSIVEVCNLIVLEKCEIGE